MTHEEILNKVIQDMIDGFGYQEQVQIDGSTKLVFPGNQTNNNKESN